MDAGSGDNGSAGWRFILHADLDAFYASVEQHDDPTLRGRPVVVGGSPESRGVVAAASYEARRFGIHSAMPMRTALQMSSQVIRVSPRFNRYQEVSRAVMAVFREVTPLIEPMSLDEAYLDVTESTASPGDAEAAAAGIRTQVRRRIGLAVTIGGGTSKTVAKVASQVAKPDGLLIIQPGDERSFLAPLKVGLLMGVGPKTEEMLGELGITIIGQLASRDEADLRAILGSRGPGLRERAMGVDESRVTSEHDRKSVSAETTFARDIGDPAELRARIEAQAREVAEDVQRRGLRGRTVRLKLRLSDFTTFTRQETLDTPTNDSGVIARVSRQLLERELEPGRHFRLIGVGVTNFQEIVQLPLLPL
ncbi:MAG: DNA polymerase IV [Chloroflexi bacterium]|nr:DNA polymerase IV [Chloroflexota bacterium]